MTAASNWPLNPEARKTSDGYLQIVQGSLFLSNLVVCRRRRNTETRMISREVGSLRLDVVVKVFASVHCRPSTGKDSWTIYGNQ